MKISEVLKLAKTTPFYYTFICDRIRYLNISQENKYKSRKYIHSLIGDYFSVKEWLEDEAKIPSEQLTEENMKIYRQRWIDHMIKELEKDGR